MKNKLIFIGPIHAHGAGDSVKNRLFLEQFNSFFDKIIHVNVWGWKKRPWVLVRLFFVLLFNRGAKVVISASGAASYLISFLYYIPLKKHVYFWVIGGCMHDLVREGHYNQKALASLDAILVEGNMMVKALNALGLQNVRYVPNAKPITFIPVILPKKIGDPYRFVFLSRVHPHKGIQEICEAVESLNKAGWADRFIVDFYGRVEPDYQADFQHLMAKYPQVAYRGFLDLTKTEGYHTLSTYDAMLFPTYWGGEGFPGVVLDANMAGLPIIATDWNLNKEVVEHGKTGFIIPVHDSAALAEAMVNFISREVDLLQMKQHCVMHVQQYDTQKVVSEQLLKDINLI